VALWGGWLVSLALGSSYLDRAGQPIGIDYLQFYAAGLTLRRGASAHLYDMVYQLDLQQEIIGPALRSYHAFITPPFLAWLFVPLASLPHGLSLAVWSLLSFAFLGLSLHLLGAPRPTCWRALTWFPVFAAISFGQNSLLTLVLLTLVLWLWRRGRLMTAGLVASLVTYKPQLLLGVVMLWVLDLRSSWRSLGGLVVGSALLASLCAWLLPEASRSYVYMALHVFPGLPSWQEFPIWHLHTVRGFWWLLLPGRRRLADVLTGAMALWGTVAFGRFRKRYVEDRALLGVGAICLTLWLTPHAMIYDWALLLVPAVVLWQRLPNLHKRWRVVFTAMWLATLVSGPLTLLQLRFFPCAVQLSVPAFLVVLTVAYHELALIKVVA